MFLYVYDNLNRLLEDDDFVYTYDNNGNLISKADKVTTANTTYQYDAENRLTQVVTHTDIVEYRYDGFGRRIAKTLNGVSRAKRSFLFFVVIYAASRVFLAEMT